MKMHRQEKSPLQGKESPGPSVLLPFVNFWADFLLEPQCLLLQLQKPTLNFEAACHCPYITFRNLPADLASHPLLAENTA